MNPLDRRPIVVAVAGPNGAGKTTFYHAHLKHAGLRFVNADDLAREFGIDATAGAVLADVLRRELVKRRESFVFETVFSDPVGAKREFLQQARAAGSSVVLCFIGVVRPAISEERIAMRVSQGGHDVPKEKVKARFPRILKNLRAAIRELPLVLVFDNSDLLHPFRRLAISEGGRQAWKADRIPAWFRPFLR